MTAQPNVALIVANTDWYLYNFRRPLIEAVAAKGWNVVLACTEGEYARRLRSEGWTVECVNFPGGQIAPIGEMASLRQLAALMRRHRPRVVHLFTLKCVLYGMLAGIASPGRPRLIGALTGLGYLFSSSGPKNRIIRAGVITTLRVAIKHQDAQLIFQNSQDFDEFEQAQVLSRSRMHLIRGSGVNTRQFDLPSTPRDFARPLRVLYCGRLIREKGIDDYLDAVARARSAGVRLASRIAGAPFPGNPSSISETRLAALERDAGHEYVGHCDDMAALFAQTDIVILPTYYREGTPKSLLEAAAAGCIIITTTISACDGIVDERDNGFRVPPRSPQAIADCLAALDTSSTETLGQMSERSRALMCARFDVTAVNAATLALYPAIGQPD